MSSTVSIAPITWGEPFRPVRDVLKGGRDDA